MNQSHFLRSNCFRTAIAIFFIASSEACGVGGKDVAVKITDLPAGHPDIVFSVAFSPDGEHLAIVALNGKINIWDWRGAHVVNTITTPLGFNKLDATSPMIYSPDGQFFAAADGRGPTNEFARIWNTKTWSVAKDILNDGVGYAAGASFTPDGRFFLYIVDRIGSPGDTLVAYAVTGWQQVWSLPNPNGFNAVSIAVSPDGTRMAMGGRLMVVPTDIADPMLRAQQTQFRPRIYLVDLRDHRVIRTISGDAMGPMAWSPDSKRIAVAGLQYVEIFDAESGQPLMHEKVEGSSRMNVRFTPNGRYFLESDMDALHNSLGLKIWDSNRHQLLQQIPGNIGDIALSRDGGYLAVATTGRTTIWRFKADEPLRK
jgi:WD40 repeat protein